MTAWIAAVPAAFVALTLLMFPGLAIGWAFRLRGLWLWAAAGPLSISTIAVASVVLSFIGAPWGILGVTAVTIALTMLVWLLVSLWWKQQIQPVSGGLESRSDPGKRVTVVALAIAGSASILAWRIAASISSPENISQTFDNIFHLNAVRWVMNTQDASPLTIGLMNSPQGNLGFYPSAWHAFVSLVVDISNATIPVAANSTNVVLAAVVWSSGAMLLTRTVLGNNTAVIISTAVMAAGFAAFPMLPLHYGVLYPLFLGLAQVPVGIAALLSLLNFGEEPLKYRPPTLWLLVLALIPGVALAHPGALMAWLALSVPLVSVWAWTALRAGTGRWRVVLIYVAYLIAGLAALLLVRPPRAQATWGNVMSVPRAGVNYLTSQLAGPAIPIVVGSLVLLGVVIAIVRRNKTDVALLGMYLMGAVLFIVVAGVPVYGIRFWVTGVWYQNVPRIESLAVIALLPLGVMGMQAVLSFVWRLARGSQGIESKDTRFRKPLAMIFAVLVWGVLSVGIIASAPISRISESIHASYAFTEDSALVSSDELALLNRLDGLVPEGSTIVTNGWTGAGMAYALSNRWVTMPHVMIDFTPDVLTLNNSLNEATPGSDTCRAAEAERADFVLDFGAREVHGGTHLFPGLERLDESPAVELVDQQGEARLYRIVACDAEVSATTTKGGV